MGGKGTLPVKSGRHKDATATETTLISHNSSGSLCAKGKGMGNSKEGLG